jgi:hypothetical protein
MDFPTVVSSGYSTPPPPAAIAKRNESPSRVGVPLPCGDQGISTSVDCDTGTSRLVHLSQSTGLKIP